MTLLERIKSGEVKKVHNDAFGVSKKIILDEKQETYEIFVEFECGETETFTNEGFVVYKSINMTYDIHPYNDPSEVQPEQSEPQPTLEDFAGWVIRNTYALFSRGFTSTELIELYKNREQ